MSLQEIRPQPGPQEQFLMCDADIALFGGGAGGGKTYSLLLDPLYHLKNPRFGAVIFRRNSVQVRNQGGLWDESMKLYYPLGGHPRQATLEWKFPGGMPVKFAHLENENTVYDWQGSQIAWIGWDELTHFTSKQFWYMLSRNRSMSGLPGRMRGTCNPDANSWVRQLVDWWIGPEGFPIPERSGVLRWFIRQDDMFLWADSRKELIDKYGSAQHPKSFTFIPSLLHDNKILMEKDPAYLANLMALSKVERERLLKGNWNITASAGTMFQRGWFRIIEAFPAQVVMQVRFWDRAATKPNPGNPNPCWTRGVRLFKMSDGTFIVADVAGIRDTPLQVEQFIRNIASQDTHNCRIVIEQEPGSSGIADAQNMVRLLAGYDVRVSKPSADKVTRALPVSAQCEAGNVKVLKGAWNEEFFSELENFSEDTEGHVDQVDALSGAFNELTQEISMFDVL